MKAVVKLEKGYDHMQYMDIDEPQVSDDFIKIKVAYNSICGTDLHAFEGKYPSTKPPVVLGHEFSGVVVDIGENVKKFKVGDRVVTETTISVCGECPTCITEDYNLCSNKIGIGTKYNGGMGEYVLAKESSAHIIPDNVSLKGACLIEPLACGAHACMEVTTVSKNDIVCVFGVGPIGLLLAQAVKGNGAYVIMAGLSNDKENFEIAKSFGVDRCVDQMTEDLKEVILEITGIKGVDKVFECSGSPHALNAAFEVVKKKGEVVQMGVFGTEKISVNTNMLLHKEIIHKGSRSSKPTSWKKAIDLMAKGLVLPEKIITDLFTLENWREGFEKSIAGNSVKSIIVLDDTLE